MKKILLFLGLFFFFSHINLYAKDFNPLIVHVGAGEDSFLELDDCNLITHNVNWNKVGRYQATYYNQKTKTHFTRPIQITNFDETDVGLGVFDNITYELKKDEGIYHVKGYVQYGDNGFFLYGTIDYEEEIKQTFYLQEYAFLSFYQDGKLIWQKVYDDAYSYISGAVATDLGIVFVLSYEVLDQADMSLIELNVLGDVVRTLEIKTPGIEQGYDLFGNKDYLYLVCTSDATSGDILYQYDALYISIIKISYHNFEITDYRCYGNVGTNIFYKAIYINQTFYLLFQAIGYDGRHQNDKGGYTGYFLAKIDEDFQTEKVYYVDVKDYYYDLYVCYHDIVFVSQITKNKECYLKFHVFDEELSYRTTYYWKYPLEGYEIYNIISFRNSLDEIILAMNVRNNKGEFYPVFLTVFDYQRYGFVQYKDQPLIILKASFENDILFFFGIDDDGFTFINGLIIESEIIDQYKIVNRNYNVRRIKINNLPYCILGETRNNYPFGHHQDLYQITYHDATIYFYDNYYVYEKININNGETYDTGIKISFNGEGYLNDELVISPIVINNPGEYCLIIYGNSGERKVINFKVKNLCLVPKPKEAISFDIDGIDLNHINHSHNLHLTNDYIILNPSSKQKEVIIFVIINSIFILVSLFPWRKLWVR